MATLHGCIVDNGYAAILRMQEHPVMTQGDNTPLHAAKEIPERFHEDQDQG